MLVLWQNILIQCILINCVNCKQDLYKKYGFESHKGYGTKVHMEALQKYGPIEGFHRFSYQPVKNSIKV